MAGILVVDDELSMREFLKILLEKEGHRVTTAAEGKTALALAEKTPFDLLISDIRMPGMTGLELLALIKQLRPETAVIMITAFASPDDAVTAMKHGAFDYITKPFNILELKARIRALIRRSSMAPAAPAEPDSGKLVRGHIEIDPERRSAHRFGQNVELTLKEFDLIELLMRNPGKVYSREQLLDLVWGYDYQGDIRTVDVHIRRLREKLERNPAAPEYIITKWGVGYYFAEA